LSTNKQHTLSQGLSDAKVLRKDLATKSKNPKS
jgi:hypothetical protein